MSEFRLTRRSTLVGGAAAIATGLAAPAHASAAGSALGAGHRPTPGWVTQALKSMTLEQKIGQLFVQYVYGADADTPDARNIPLFGLATPSDIVKKFGFGGVIYFAWTDSVNNPQQIAALSDGLQRAALSRPDRVKIPLSISTDQEQGVVTRVGPPLTQFPGSMALGAGRRPQDAETAARITGEELRAIGINANFAPVCDVNVNPLNPVIGTRSFGSKPELVAAMVAAQVRGYQRPTGVSSSAKHFPGHGDTATDSHVAFPVITHSRAQWEAIDAPPFKAAIAAGIDMIMTAHLSMPALDDSGDPATLSRPVITGLLREELGFDGVIITDSLEMQGVRDRYGDAEVAVRALTAGADQVLMTPAPLLALKAVTDAVASGRITMADLDAKVGRILTMKMRRGIVASPYVVPALIKTRVGTKQHLAAADAVSNSTTTVIKNDGRVLPISPSGRKILVTGYGVTATQTLGDALTRRGAKVTVEQTGAAPTTAAIAETVAAATSADMVIVTTMKAWDTAVTDKAGGQQKLVKQLLATGATVIVVAVRDPYDIAYFTAAPTYVATYSYNAVAIEALARVLVGEVSPAGKLPVDIPVAGQPNQILYPFGHGLS